MLIKRTTLGAAAALALSTSAALAAPAVTASDLNMRTGPGVGYGVITAIPVGASVDVRGCDGGWCEVAWAGNVGYSSRSYLDIGGPVARTTTTIVTPPSAVYVPGPTYSAFPSYGYYGGPTLGFSFGYDNNRNFRGARRAIRREIRQDRRQDRGEARREIRQDRREMRRDARMDNRREARVERRQRRN